MTKIRTIITSNFCVCPYFYTISMNSKNYYCIFFFYYSFTRDSFSYSYFVWSFLVTFFFLIKRGRLFCTVFVNYSSRDVTILCTVISSSRFNESKIRSAARVRCWILKKKTGTAARLQSASFPFLFSLPIVSFLFLFSSPKSLRDRSRRRWQGTRCDRFASTNRVRSWDSYARISESEFIVDVLILRLYVLWGRTCTKLEPWARSYAHRTKWICTIRNLTDCFWRGWWRKCANSSHFL